MPDARAHHPPPADPRGPRVPRRSPRLARPPPASASSATSSTCRRRGGAQYLPDPDATDAERPPPALTSDLHEEIFLRVASPVDLARASAACVSFRRLIADHAFLRRYRSIHPPLLLGFIRPYGLAPAEAPHPSAAVARAVSFSFDYLPPTTRWDENWSACGARHGRVLFSLIRSSRRKGLHFDLLVCDPLSRRYMLLPPITDDLLASIGIQNQDIFDLGASFIRSEDTEGTSFSVISWMLSSSRLGIFIFSSGSGCWSVSTSISWEDLGLDEIRLFISEQCTNDFFYWKLEDMSTLIKLDINSMRFCTIGLPAGHEERQIVIVESGESGVAMFSTIEEGTSVDYYTSQNGSENSHEWHLKSTIPLPAHYTFEVNISGPAEGYIFIECMRDEPDTTYSTFFSLEIKSSNIERVGRTHSSATGAYPYFGFPPSMSPRRI